MGVNGYSCLTAMPQFRAVSLSMRVQLALFLYKAACASRSQRRRVCEMSIPALVRPRMSRWMATSSCVAEANSALNL
jgi:hypothetical protein